MGGYQPKLSKFLPASWFSEGHRVQGSKVLNQQGWWMCDRNRDALIAPSWTALQRKEKEMRVIGLQKSIPLSFGSRKSHWAVPGLFLENLRGLACLCLPILEEYAGKGCFCTNATDGKIEVEGNFHGLRPWNLPWRTFMMISLWF